MYRLSDLKERKTSLPEEVLIQQPPDSILLFKAENWYVASDAVIQTALSLGGIYKLIVLAYVLPKWLRDWVYNFVAKNRYRWFGKNHRCDTDMKT